MAHVLGNVSMNSNGSSQTSNYGGSNYILKDSVKQDWYIYRASPKSVVRPYPVYDGNGIPCSITGSFDPENPFSVFSEAFAIVPLVVFAGLDGKLQFIDYCPDIDQYAPAGTALTRTPYSFFISGLREMLPERDTNKTKSGLPTPPRLSQASKNVHYAATSLVFRGAMVRAKGRSSESKHAVNGIMFKAVFYVSVQSAINAMVAEFQKPKDPRKPWSQTNSAADGLFELDGLTIQFDKTGTDNSAPYQVSFGYEPGFADAAAKFFNLPAKDPMAYHAAVRAMFGQDQSLPDIFRLLSVAELVGILKEHYPISWVYWGLKDSPYANLLTPDDRDAALRDPEMAPWFGVSHAFSTPAPATAPAAPAASRPQVQYPSSGFPQASAAGAPMGPAVAAPQIPVPTPQPQVPPNNAVADKLAYWQQKYANNTAGQEDGLKY